MILAQNISNECKKAKEGLLDITKKIKQTGSNNDNNGYTIRMVQEATDDRTNLDNQGS